MIISLRSNIITKIEQTDPIHQINHLYKILLPILTEELTVPPLIYKKKLIVTEVFLERVLLLLI